MAASNKIIIAFDLYGTLLSTESIAHELAKQYGEEAAGPQAALWRRYQLEYTWRINSMGEYRPFDELTRSALHHAAAEQGLAPPAAAAADALMRSYDALRAFPEVPAALDLLASESGGGAAAAAAADAYVFSNGTDAMVGNSVRSSPDLGPRAAAAGFRALVSVDGLRCYKPDPRAYAHLVETVGAGDVWLVSANPFDVAGARAAGLRAAFVDRSGRGWVDRLDEARAPTVVVRGLDEAVRAILGKSSSSETSIQ